MSLNVKIVPEDAGCLVQTEDFYRYEKTYVVGDLVKIKIVPKGPYQFTGWEGDIPEEEKDNMPLAVKFPDDDREIVATFRKVPDNAPELVFDSNFENGNGILRYYDRNARSLIIEPEQVNLADNIWWHFKIKNIIPGEFLQLHLGHWPVAGDCQPVYSYDGVNWQRMAGIKSPFIQRFDSEKVEIARNIPYLYSRSLALAKEIKNPMVEPQTLTKSEEGRSVVMLRATDPRISDEKKKIIWIMARTHAFESHSSYYAEGIIKWLDRGSPEAMDLLRRFIVFIVPIMDVDSVFKGGSGKEQLTRDHQRVDFNRQWGDYSHWAAIRSAKLLLEEIMQHHEIAAFIDLHNPWYPESPHWDPPEEFENQIRELAEIFTAQLQKVDTNILWKHNIIVWKGTGQGIEPTLDANLVASTKYAAKKLFRTIEQHLCFVIELPHWMDGYGNPITKRHLFTYGEALGRALGIYLK